MKMDLTKVEQILVVVGHIGAYLVHIHYSPLKAQMYWFVWLSDLSLLLLELESHRFELEDQCSLKPTV